MTWSRRRALETTAQELPYFALTVVVASERQLFHPVNMALQ